MQRVQTNCVHKQQCKHVQHPSHSCSRQSVDGGTMHAMNLHRALHTCGLARRPLARLQAGTAADPSLCLPHCWRRLQCTGSYSTVMGSADTARPGVGSRPGEGSGGGCCASNSSHAFSKVTLMCAHMSCRLWQACLRASVAEISPAAHAAPRVFACDENVCCWPRCELWEGSPLVCTRRLTRLSEGCGML